MGKKKAVKPTLDGANKSRLQLRLDTDVFEGIHRLAEDSGISANQLMHALARWAVKNGHPGEGYEEKGAQLVRPQIGCIFFGEPGALWSSDQERREEEQLTHDEAGPCRNPGKKIFQLDFTERHVIQED